MSREAVLGRIRTALGRRAGERPTGLPDPLLFVPPTTANERMQHFLTALHALNGKTCLATSAEEARAYVDDVTQGKRAICADAAVLRECGIDKLPSVNNSVAASQADIGITGAEYALANTGTLVMLASAENPRMTSLLPPVHIAVVRESTILSNLDELFTSVRLPADITSSMVLITGPSRTADIEQILVRGVHGPGELHVVLLRN
jgi:L-lactate dehydrogenase complex protein LldG